jgi:hypothetical protein
MTPATRSAPSIAPGMRRVAQVLCLTLLTQWCAPLLAADLTIGDGVVLKFGPDAQLLVRDKLVPGKGVILTSQKDDTAGGQTGPAAQTAAPGDWRGMRIEKSSSSFGALTFDSWLWRYAGADGGTGANPALNLRSVAPTLKYVQFTDNLIGLHLQDVANPAISGSSFLRNQTGVLADGDSLPVIGSSQLIGNSAFSINNTSSNSINASGNWWGHASGPQHASNPAGQGDPVSSGVSFANYLAAQPLINPQISLAGSASYFEQHELLLNIGCINAEEYRISEDANFTGASFVPMNPSPSGTAQVRYTTSDGDGLKTLYVQFRSGSAQTNAQLANVRIDSAGPSVALQNPQEGGVVTRSITLSATASDPAGVQKVEFLVDNVSIGNVTSAPYTLAWDVSALANGAHTVRAQATDAVGHTSFTEAHVSLTKLTSSFTKTVPGNANIWGAGHAVPPAPGGDGAGVLPPMQTFEARAGQVLTFTDVAGQVACSNTAPLNGPDGGPCVGSTDISAYGGISGIKHNGKTMFMVGVFLDGNEPGGTAPATLDFSNNTDFANFAPLIGQIFYIGDGLTGTNTGNVQRFFIPPTATRFYMGFTDAPNAHGAPGGYGDNPGSLTASFDITRPADADVTGPVIANVKFNGSAFTDGQTISRSGNFSLTATDPAGVVRAEAWLDNVLFASSTNSANFSLPLNLDNVSNGNHTLQLRAYDSLSNPSSLSFSLTAAHAVPDAPTISQPANGLTTRTASQSVSGNTLPAGQVQLLVNGQAQGSLLNATSDGRFSGNITLTAGSNAITATVSNQYGTSLPSAAINATLDLSIPGNPGNLVATAQAAGKVHLSWVRASDPNVTGYWLYRASSATTPIEQAQKLTSSPITATVYDDLPAPDGTWYYRVVAVNNLGTPSQPGNTASASSDSSLPRALSILYTPLGRTDAQTGRIGQGRVNLVLNTSEALPSAPYLAIVPQGGAPIVVDLQSTGPTSYSGSFVIDANTPSGVANALFSARDAVGNRGTDVDSGASLRIDTQGPDLSSIVLSPVAPIKNEGAPTISASFTFSKAPKVLPQVNFKLSGSGRSAQSVGSLSAINATSYSASFTLPADAGLAAPENLSFSFQAQDDLDNFSTRVSGVNRFQVYQGNLPPLLNPFGFTAKAQPGGKVKLTWQAVDDAFAYQLYRQAPGQTALQALARSGGLEYIDATLQDGNYKYAVASVRQSNGQESVSAVGAVLEVHAIATRPNAPQTLNLLLTGQGIYATWQAAVGPDVDYYNLYRASGTAITSIDGLTPIKTRIKNPVTYDTNPSPTQGAYVVTAVDTAGNESAISNSAYLNASLLPVRNLQVIQADTDLPQLSWQAPNGNLAGYLVYVTNGTTRTKLTPNLITDTRFTDTGYAGGERLYSVVAVDSAQVELARNILLPAVSSRIISGLPLKRGVMNKLQVEVTNSSGNTLGGVQAVVRLPIDRAASQFKEHRSEAVTLSPNQTWVLSVVVGGYADLPDNVAAAVGVEIVGEDEKVKLARSQNFEVNEGALVVGMATSEFTRGATGKLKLTIENTSEVEVELLTATGNGANDSSELRFKLLDTDGNVLATQPYKQALGANVITLPNGQTVARIAGGSNFTSEEFSLNIPAASPNSIRVRLEVDKLRYHSGKDDEVQIAGRGSERSVSLLDTAYYGEVTRVEPQSSYGDQDIIISGRAIERNTNNPLPNTRLKLVLNQQGFERNLVALTDGSGNFAYRFQPTLGDSGNYRVSAVHPDITDRPEQKSFTINRVTVGPSPFKLDLPKGADYSIPLVGRAGAGTVATNLRLVADAASQPTGSIPAGITLDLPHPNDLRAGQSVNMPVIFHSTQTAEPSGSVVLNVISDEHASTPIGQVRINYTLSEALPYLVSTPNLVESGLSVGSSQIESVSIKNNGLQEAQNLQFSLTKPDNSPAPGWATLASAANGTLAVGATRAIDLQFAPGNGVQEGVYELRLNLRGDNIPNQSLNVYVSVTANGQGSILFKASDIYTATLDTQGNLIKGLANANVTLQNEEVATVTYALSTDNLGEALFQGVPAGRYKFRAKANNHQEVAGRLTVRPGVSLTQPVFLDYNLITVEWSVREVTIQDRYDITLNATFETNVPAAVVVMQPASVNLPKMNSGDVFYGELVLTNYGLVRADRVRQRLPAGDAFFRYEFLVEVPDTLAAKQRVTIPYRVVALQTLGGAVSNGFASGGGCYSYSNSTAVTCEYDCANGNRTTCGSSTSFFSYSNSTCGGNGGGSSGSSGGSGAGIGGGIGGIGSPSTTIHLGDEKCVYIPKGECKTCGPK